MQDNRRLINNLINIERFFDKEMRSIVLEALQNAKKIIYDRTHAGVSVEGDSFKGYSKDPASVTSPYNKTKSKFYPKGYHQFRQDTGRTTQPNLHYTGRMFQALKPISWTSSRGKLGFTSEKERLKARGNNETREFFGLNYKEQKKIFRLMRNDMRRYLRNVIR